MSYLKQVIKAVLESTTPWACECCCSTEKQHNEAAKQSALDAGIPLSVIEGRSKLSDHFSAEQIAEEAHDKGEDCGEEKCQVCCPHDERDHGICMDCEHEEDPGAAIDRAMDAMEDR